MIIWVASQPRAGNTLFRLLLHHYCGIKTYSMYDDAVFVRTKVAKIIGHTKLPRELANFVRVNEARNDRAIFIKTHHHPSAVPGACQTAVCIIRDPRGAAVSLAHYKKWRKNAKFQDSLWTTLNRSNWAGYINAWRAVPNMSIVRYEDMLREPQQVIETVIETLGIDLEILTSTSPVTFRKLHKRLPGFFRVGKADAWQDTLSAEQEALALKRHGPMMKEMGYL